MENLNLYKVLRKLIEMVWQTSNTSSPDYKGLAHEISKELDFEISGRSIRDLEQLAYEPNLNSKETHHKLSAFVLFKQGEVERNNITTKQTNKKIMLEGTHWWESFIDYYKKQYFFKRKPLAFIGKRVDEEIVLKSDKFLFHFNKNVNTLRFSKLLSALFFVVFFALLPIIINFQANNSDHSFETWWSSLWKDGEYRTVLCLSIFALTYPIVAAYYKHIPTSINRVFNDQIFVKSAEQIERFEIYSLRIFNLRRIRKTTITFLFAAVLAFLFVFGDLFGNGTFKISPIYFYNFIVYTLILYAYCTFVMNSFEHTSILQSIRNDVLSNVLVFNYQKNSRYHCGGVRPIGMSIRYLYIVLFFIGVIILILSISSSINLLNFSARPVRDMLSLISACFMAFHLVAVLYWSLLFVSFVSYYTPKEKKLRRVITLFNLIY